VADSVLFLSPLDTQVAVLGPQAEVDPLETMNNQRNQILRELDIKGRKLLEFSTENNDKPQFFVSTEDISRVFFYLQHEQSYHIASKGNFHLSHSRRKLHACTF
jgi:hypothetical protein